MNKPNILLFEDNLDDGSELVRTLDKYAFVTWVKDIKNINGKIDKMEWDCFIFDDDINGNKVGKQILIESIRDGRIPKMKSILFSKHKPGHSLNEFGIVSFVDKGEAAWKIQLIRRIHECLPEKSGEIMLDKMLEESQCFDDEYRDYIDTKDDFLNLSTIGILTSVNTIRDIHDLLRSHDEDDQINEIDPVAKNDLEEMLREVYSKKMKRRYSEQ